MIKNDIKIKKKIVVWKDCLRKSDKCLNVDCEHSINWLLIEQSVEFLMYTNGTANTFLVIDQNTPPITYWLYLHNERKCLFISDKCLTLIEGHQYIEIKILVMKRTSRN